jgi:hypothetical protein
MPPYGINVCLDNKTVAIGWVTRLFSLSCVLCSVIGNALGARHCSTARAFSISLLYCYWVYIGEGWRIGGRKANKAAWRQFLDETSFNPSVSIEVVGYAAECQPLTLLNNLVWCLRAEGEWDGIG